MYRISILIAFVLGIFAISPASAQVVITQAKALAGGITPGDTAGYPITISQPGAYRLDGNLTVPPNVYGIYVTANNVDIDMNGFTLTGAGTGTWGVISNSGESRIHDGVINRFRYSGIYLRNSDWMIRNMQITRNGTLGVDATGSRSIRIEDSIIDSNGSRGIFAGDQAFVLHSSIQNNGGSGIECLNACHIEGSIIEQNETGISVDSGMIIGNTISRNRNYGFFEYAPLNAGLASNIFIDNNTGGLGQRVGGVDLNPNACVSSPC